MAATLVGPPTGTNAPTDLEQLQGAWTSVAGSRNARLLIAGNHFSIEFLDGPIYMGSFALVDPEAQPRRMDMCIAEGPPAHLGRVAHCIYELESDSLRWCPNRPGAHERLTHFPSVHDDRYVSIVFKQDRPPRPH